eukprot:2205-Heterococcus_DN1.PRE.2
MHALIAVMFKSCCCYVLSQHPCHVQCDVTQSYWTLRLLVLLHISLCVKLTRASALDQCITPMHSVYATFQAYCHIHDYQCVHCAGQCSALLYTTCHSRAAVTRDTVAAGAITYTTLRRVNEDRYCTRCQTDTA